MSQKNTVEDIGEVIGNLLSGLFCLAILAFIGGLFIFNPITQGVLGMAMDNRNRQAISAKFYYDRHFREQCPAWRDASLYERWTDWRVTDLGWCRGYVDRL